MSGVLGFFKKGLTSASQAELPDIFPLSLQSAEFIRTDLLSTYLKILTDTLERTHGLNSEYETLLWDNCVQSETTEGLTTMLAQAMVDKADLFLVYLPSVNILRKATNAERQKIEADYKVNGESENGVYISFKNYRRTDMLKIYSALEYCAIASLHKTVNISKAVQIKMADLRNSVSLADSGVAVEQARSLAEALRSGKDILLDVKDNVTTATPDVTPTEKAIAFLDAKKAFILGLPLAYISGEQTSGIGSTGEADMRAVERGLKQYFFSIVQPVLRSIFRVEVEFKSQDFRQITSALEALKTFDLVSDENLSRESKQEILARMFDIDPKKEKKALEKEAKEREEDPPISTPSPVVEREVG